MPLPLKGLSVHDTSLPSPHLQVFQVKCTNYLHSEICPEMPRTDSRAVSAFKSLAFEEPSFVLAENFGCFSLKGAAASPEAANFAQHILASPFLSSQQWHHTSFCRALAVKHFWGFEKQSSPAGISMGCLVIKNFPEILVGALKLLHGFVSSCSKHVLSLWGVCTSPPALGFLLTWHRLLRVLSWPDPDFPDTSEPMEQPAMDELGLFEICPF